MTVRMRERRIPKDSAVTQDEIRNSQQGDTNAGGAGPAPVRAAPPTVGGRVYVPRRGPSWPDWLGVLCVVFGFLGVLVGVATLFSYGPMTHLVKGMPQGEELVRLTERFKWANRISMGAYVLCQAYLCYVGALAFRRSARLPRQARLWSKLKICVIAATVIIWALSQFQIMKVMVGTGALIVQPMWLAYGPMIGQMVLGTLFQLALPVFLLFWFRNAGVMGAYEAAVKRAQVARAL